MTSNLKHLLASGAGMAAIFAALPANAQSNTFEDEVIATGIRSSLEQSLDVKRQSVATVDAITAEDVGKFPDNNIAESLQRITGVAIDRSGGEGQFITVRGLGPEFNVVTLNGRTLATDNDGREFSFDVISSDIIQRAEVFKTSQANLQSGGIGANVNIVTNRPLGRGGNSLTGSIAGTYDTQRDEISPDATVVGKWQNEDGTFGFAGGVSYSDRKSQIDRVFTNGFSARGGAAFVNAPENSVGLTEADISTLPDNARVQQQVIIARDTQDRERLTLNGTAQFRPNDAIELTVDGLYSEFDIQSFESQFSGFFSPPFIDPVVDANGTVTSFYRPSIDFNARNPAIAGQIGLSQNDNVITSNNRKAETYLVGGNLSWQAADNVKTQLDVSTSKATREGSNPFVVLGALAPESPLISLPDDADISTLTNIVGAQDTSIQRLHFVNINEVDIDDEIVEVKTQTDWDIDKGPLATLSAGLAFSDREKSRVQRDNFAPSQGAGIFCAYCGYTVDFDDGILRPIRLDGFLSGVAGTDRIPLDFLTSTFEEAFAALNSDAAITAADRSGRGTLSDADLIARRNATDSIYGFYDPAVNPGAGFAVDEQVKSVWVNSAWNGDFNGAMPWSATLGFRLAETETRSSGVDQPVTQFRESDGDTQLSPIFGTTSQVSVENSYTNFLPSASIKLETTEDTVLRASISETVTRPTLTSLGVNNFYGGRSNAPTSGGGNPELEAFESTNYDIGFEWYFGDISYFAVNGFHKDFSNFLEQATLGVPGVVVIPAGNVGNDTGADLSTNVTFQDTRTRNGETGSITGLEVGLQQGFDNGFGYGLNYTYVSSNINRQSGAANEFLDYNGLSPHTLNANIFFERGPIQARLAYNYRDEFLVLAQGVQSEPEQREAFGQVDVSAAYEINDRFQVFAEGVNLLNEERRDFSRFKNRFLTLEDTGSRYTIGVRGTF